jgi:hypothetical protein
MDTREREYAHYPIRRRRRGYKNKTGNMRRILCDDDNGDVKTTHEIWIASPYMNVKRRLHYIKRWCRRYSTKTGNVFVRLTVFNATFDNISVISWRSALLVEETGVHTENHQPAASHWQTLSHNVALIETQTYNISGDMHWLHK